MLVTHREQFDYGLSILYYYNSAIFVLFINIIKEEF